MQNAPHRGAFFLVVSCFIWDLVFCGTMGVRSTRDLSCPTKDQVHNETLCDCRRFSERLVVQRICVLPLFADNRQKCERMTVHRVDGFQVCAALCKAPKAKAFMLLTCTNGVERLFGLASASLKHVCRSPPNLHAFNTYATQNLQVGV